MTTSQRSETVGNAEPGPRDAGDGRELLREMCRSLTDVLREARLPARRVAMAVGEVTLEVEWASHPDLPDGAAVEGPRAVPAGLPSTSSAPVPDGLTGQHGATVRSPLVGTFYAAPEPGARPFVEKGDLVEAGQQVAIIEAMKLMNPVEADRTGRVVDILVSDAQAVEYDQPLMVLEPADGEE